MRVFNNNFKSNYLYPDVFIYLSNMKNEFDVKYCPIENTNIFKNYTIYSTLFKCKYLTTVLIWILNSNLSFFLVQLFYFNLKLKTH